MATPLPNLIPTSYWESGPGRPFLDAIRQAKTATARKEAIQRAADKVHRGQDAVRTAYKAVFKKPWPPLPNYNVLGPVHKPTGFWNTGDGRPFLEAIKRAKTDKTRVEAIRQAAKATHTTTDAVRMAYKGVFGATWRSILKQVAQTRFAPPISKPDKSKPENTHYRKPRFMYWMNGEGRPLLEAVRTAKTEEDRRKAILHAMEVSDRGADNIRVSYQHVFGEPWPALTGGNRYTATGTILFPGKAKKAQAQTALVPVVPEMNASKPGRKPKVVVDGLRPPSLWLEPFLEGFLVGRPQTGHLLYAVPVKISLPGGVKGG